MIDAEVVDEAILEQARQIILKRIRKPGGIVRHIEELQRYMTIEYAALHNEEFGCMFLDQSYGLINHIKMFRGTIDSCAVYPREIAREALLQNAMFVVLIHNHPAHNTIPSDTDIEMTLKIKNILAVLDIVLFDHIIVAGLNLYSMRTNGHLS